MRELYAHEGLPFDAAAGRAALHQILSCDPYGRVYLIQVAEATVGYLVITFGFSLEYGGCDAFLDESYSRFNLPCGAIYNDGLRLRRVD